jgi:hypothetical protein
MDAIAQGEALVPRDDLVTAWRHLTGSCEQKDWWAEPSQLWPNPPFVKNDNIEDDGLRS